MKCHYEVLNVPRDASDSDIKAAYRKLALKWHPDKNLENSEFAKEQFQLVQQAYEVLSDRQERAWYDNHREQILRGASSEFEDKSLDVFQYFNTSCFNGYGDDEKGFFAVYRNVFENIAKEDMEFMENKEEFCQVPSFGNSKSDYEKVSDFYNYWLNYSTKKSYVWLDPYDITGARDRRYVKLVEKENKKVRQKARKDRNEEVRNLVAFVKKRDRRVLAQKKIQEQKLIENKKKRELLTMQKKLERQQELNESGNQPEWSKFDNVKSELEAIEKNLVEQFGEEFMDSEDEEQDKYHSNLYCVACNKIFKTTKAFENHELSKKHRENVASLKDAMLNESDYDEEDNNLEENTELETNYEECREDDFDQDDIEATEDVTQNKSKKKRKSRNVIAVNLQESQTVDVDENILNIDNSVDNCDVSLNKKPKKKKRSKVKLDNNEKSSASDNMKETNKNKGSEKKKTDHEANLFDVDTNHNCVTCKSNFPSKNKLFDHLKKTGHSVYIPHPQSTKNRKKV